MTPSRAIWIITSTNSLVVYKQVYLEPRRHISSTQNTEQDILQYDIPCSNLNRAFDRLLKVFTAAVRHEFCGITRITFSCPSDQLRTTCFQQSPTYYGHFFVPMIRLYVDLDIMLFKL